MQAGGAGEWSLPDGWRLEHPLLEGEELVAGVYLRLLLRHPGFPLREPRTTLQVLPRPCECVYVCVLLGVEGQLLPLVISKSLRPSSVGSLTHTIELAHRNTLNPKHRGEVGPHEGLMGEILHSMEEGCWICTSVSASLQGLLEAYVKEAASRPTGPQRAALLAAAACQVAGCCRWMLAL